MASLFASLRRILPGFSRARTYGGTIDTNFSILQEGDRVVVQGKTPFLTKPLQRGKKIGTRRGDVEHGDIIGKHTRTVVHSHKGQKFRLSYPTLEEYVTLTPRLVTPVYPADANLIVSLLDIHTPAPSSQGGQDEPLEILEAGTGHGSLTLHLARAISGANPCPPRIPKASQVQLLSAGDRNTARNATDSTGDKDSEVTGHQTEWDEWRAQRKAVLHTVDVSRRFSAHAEGVVRGFRRGLYTGNVDFYAGSVEDWIQEQSRRRPKSLISRTVKPFLSYAVLDMPSAHLRIPLVSPVLKQNGLLAVFAPSVTQIGEALNTIREQRLPFVLDRAVELGTGISSGRLWDIRFATTRARSHTKLVTNTTDGNPDESVQEVTEDASEKEPEKESEDEIAASTQEAAKGDTVLVCRPKVGERIVGGGFVGLFRRIES